jgi:hypothetical protein
VWSWKSARPGNTTAASLLSPKSTDLDVIVVSVAKAGKPAKPRYWSDAMHDLRSRRSGSGIRVGLLVLIPSVKFAEPHPSPHRPRTVQRASQFPGAGNT